MYINKCTKQMLMYKKNMYSQTLIQCSSHKTIPEIAINKYSDVALWSF